MANVSGWNEIINNTNLVKAAYTMYDNAMYGNLIAILWVSFSAVLYMKTRNVGLIFFLGLLSYVVFYGLLTSSARGVLLVILVFELAALLYELFWSR